MRKHKLLSLVLATGLAVTTMVSPVSAASAYVTGDLLNVRTWMSTSADIVGTLSYGDDVLITYGPEDGWCEIYYEGDCYYVASEYLSVGDGGSYDYEDEDDNYDYDEDYEEDYDEEEDYEEESSSTTSGGTYLGTFTLTAYCNCAQCCGTAGNYTASGTWPEAGRTVAMGGVPFGTQLLINGHVYTVEDRGTPYGHVDIFFNNHSDALAFGMQSAEVYQLN